jgi:hypothetical protein
MSARTFAALFRGCRGGCNTLKGFSQRCLSRAIRPDQTVFGTPNLLGDWCLEPDMGALCSGHGVSNRLMASRTRLGTGFLKYGYRRRQSTNVLKKIVKCSRYFRCKCHQFVASNWCFEWGVCRGAGVKARCLRWRIGGVSRNAVVPRHRSAIFRPVMARRDCVPRF